MSHVIVCMSVVEQRKSVEKNFIYIIQIHSASFPGDDDVAYEFERGDALYVRFMVRLRQPARFQRIKIRRR